MKSLGLRFSYCWFPHASGELFSVESFALVGYHFIERLGALRTCGLRSSRLRFSISRFCIFLRAGCLHSISVAERQRFRF